MADGGVRWACGAVHPCPPAECRRAPSAWLLVLFAGRLMGQGVQRTWRGALQPFWSSPGVRARCKTVVQHCVSQAH